MIDKGLGQYDIEYAQCSCFWGIKPGKFVSLLRAHLRCGRILDLGAGEGKNAIYLAQEGFHVVAVECSRFAVSNFKKRLQSVGSVTRSRIEIIQGNVLQYEPTGKFEAVIAYGLLHCLPSKEALTSTVKLMTSATAENGINVIVTFTDTCPRPSAQEYLDPILVPVSYILNLYSSWEIKSHEHEVIEETHPTSNVSHRHSICRLLAKRNTSLDEHN